MNSLWTLDCPLPCNVVWSCAIGWRHRGLTAAQIYSWELPSSLPDRGSCQLVWSFLGQYSCRTMFVWRILLLLWRDLAWCLFLCTSLRSFRSAVVATHRCSLHRWSRLRSWLCFAVTFRGGTRSMHGCTHSVLLWLRSSYPSLIGWICTVLWASRMLLRHVIPRLVGCSSIVSGHPQRIYTSGWRLYIFVATHQGRLVPFSISFRWPRCPPTLRGCRLVHCLCP